jgi:hypothetical protein
MPPVPNQPKNKNKPIRVSEELWDEFGKVCEAEGSNRAAELRAYMEKRVKAHRRRQAREQTEQTKQAPPEDPATP